MAQVQETEVDGKGTVAGKNGFIPFRKTEGGNKKKAGGKFRKGGTKTKKKSDPLKKFR
jgi:hypothetical protein